MSNNGSAVIQKIEDAGRVAVILEDRANKDSQFHRRLSILFGSVSLLLTVVVIVLAFKNQHDVLVFRDTKSGLAYAGEPQQSLTPDEAEIEGQLASWLKACRDVPGIDYALVDRNYNLCTGMMADVPPVNAYTRMVSFLNEDTNNPKKVGKDTIRTVLDPVIASPIPGTRTWTLVWVEETEKNGVKQPRKWQQGTVTIADPRITTDRTKAAEGLTGVTVIQANLHV